MSNPDSIAVPQTDILSVPGSYTDSNELFARSRERYAEFRKADNHALVVGLFNEDLDESLKNESAIIIKSTDRDGNAVVAPLLVPVSDLEWYNHKLLEDLYPGKNVYVYVHPPFSDEEVEDVHAALIRSLDAGDVIVSEVYKDRISPIASFILEASKREDIKIESFGDENGPSSVDFFAAEISFNSVDQKMNDGSDPDIFTVYETMLNEGELQRTDSDGISLERKIIDEDAGKIWELYKNPFDDLGAKDPTKAGFTEEMLYEILGDEAIPKVVNRVDGQITTLLIFLNDLSYTPWFNEDHYIRNYPEYHAGNNILISPGIVSDETKRGNNYAVDMIDFLAKVFSRRGKDILLTFECTQISTQYIPKIIKFALEKSGVAQVDGIEKPLGTLEYFGISKHQ